MRFVLGRRAYRCAYCKASLLLSPEHAVALRMESAEPRSALKERAGEVVPFGSER